MHVLAICYAEWIVGCKLGVGLYTFGNAPRVVGDSHVISLWKPVVKCFLVADLYRSYLLESIVPLRGGAGNISLGVQGQVVRGTEVPQWGPGAKPR